MKAYVLREVNRHKNGWLGSTAMMLAGQGIVIGTRVEDGNFCSPWFKRRPLGCESDLTGLGPECEGVVLREVYI